MDISPNSNLTFQKTRELVEKNVWKRNVNHPTPKYPCMNTKESSVPGKPCNFPFIYKPTNNPYIITEKKNIISHFLIAPLPTMTTMANLGALQRYVRIEQRCKCMKLLKFGEIVGNSVRVIYLSLQMKTIWLRMTLKTFGTLIFMT